MERVSILIPVYNAEKYLRFAIDSVLKQTYTDWELIVLDDCSSDNSYTIATEFSDRYPHKIRAFKNDVNLGMLENWNKGIGFCNKEYFVKLDADDFWHPLLLEQSIAILENYPNVGIVFTKYANVDEQNHLVQESEIVLPDFAKDKAFSCVSLVKQGAESMLKYSVLRQGLSVMRRAIFNKIGIYKYLLSSETQASTDTEFYFRLGCHFDIYCIDKLYYYYRIHENSISSLDASKRLSSKKIFEVKKSIIDYYFAQNKISKLEWIINNKNNVFHFAVQNIYSSREKKNLISSLGLFYAVFKVDPGMFILFYFKRLIQKLF